jgi:WD40 repeat protein
MSCTAIIWDANTGEFIRNLPDRGDCVHLITLSNNGKLLASSCGNIIKVNCVDTGKQLYTLSGAYLGFGGVSLYWQSDRGK